MIMEIRYESQEVAVILQDAAAQASTESERSFLRGQASILAAMGEMPFPDALYQPLERYVSRYANVGGT